eukprot:scaffold293965_cov38-Prasinocladus_malaysianus.AAC.2
MINLSENVKGAKLKVCCKPADEALIILYRLHIICTLGHRALGHPRLETGEVLIYASRSTPSAAPAHGLRRVRVHVPYQ